MSNEEVTDEDIDRVLASQFPGMEFTADDRAALRLLFSAINQLRREGSSHKEMMAMVDDEVLLEVLDPQLVD